MLKRTAALAFGASLFLATQVLAQPSAPAAPPAPAAPASPPAPPAPPPPNDYADKANWLCWPGQADVCASDLTTTVVKADGSLSTETFRPDPKAPVDCFYVYPTVSNDPGVFSDMIPGPEEKNVVVVQAARLMAHCRLYAPMYRQFTLTALRAAMGGGAPPAGARPGPRPQVGYNDVRDAWNYYLAHENHGRGVILVGHSQGSGVLTQLIRNEIDGKDEQKLLISAILMGTVLQVPAGAVVGGDFKSIPLCHSNTQLGCAIAYSSFRETSPPPANSLFGRPRMAAAGMVAACVNPAALGGGTGALHSYFGSKYDWAKGKPITTPFVSVPGLLTGACVSTPEFNYLSIHINAEPNSGRASDIPGDVGSGASIQKNWGLHLIDANLVMGNLVDLVGDEAKAWAAKHR